MHEEMEQWWIKNYSQEEQIQAGESDSQLYKNWKCIHFFMKFLFHMDLLQIPQ